MPVLNRIRTHEGGSPEQVSDRPVETMRCDYSASHSLHVRYNAKERPSPQARREQLPFCLCEPGNVVVTEDDIVPACSPGKGEIGDAIVEVGSLEVENAGELIADEQQVATVEVAVDHRCRRGTGHLREPLRGSFEVPQQDAALLGKVALNEAYGIAQLRVENYLPDRWPSSSADGGKGAGRRMDRGQKPAATPILARPVSLLPGQQAEQGPPSAVPANRRLKQRRYRPTSSRKLVAETQLIVDVILRDVLAVAPQDSQASAGPDPPVGVGPLTEKMRIV